MNYKITHFTRQEFNHLIKQQSTQYGYYQTAAGTLKVFMISQGAYKTEFVSQEDIEHNAVFLMVQDVLPLLFVGTHFQHKVWQATLQIPSGTTFSYHKLAQAIGSPSASRAVARALAQNELAYFIPCHRVIGKNGDLCGYKWGLAKKSALLDSEKLI